MPGQHATTPSMMPVDLPLRVQSASPSYSSSQSRKAASKGKAKASRSPKDRRGRGQRNSAGGSKTKPKVFLPGPLSVIAAHLHDVPVLDTESFVNRPASVRIQEAKMKGSSNKKPIGRPMNGFMLYRKAYSARCKAYLDVENHQNVSVGIGQSWHKESEEIREQFNAWSKIERVNHAIAFPEYKFQPKKESTTTRRPELTPPHSPGNWDDFGDSDFPYASPPMHRRTQSLEFSSRSSSPFDDYSTCLAQSFDTTWTNATSFPSQSLPGNMSTIHPGLLQPTFDDGQYGAHGVHGSPSEMSSGLNGIPGGNHEDLYQSSQPLPSSIGSGHMDPQLLQYPQDHQSSSDHSFMTSSHLYPMGFEGENYMSTTHMPSSHSSPSIYHGLPEMEAQTWDYASHSPSATVFKEEPFAWYKMTQTHVYWNE